MADPEDAEQTDEDAEQTDWDEVAARAWAVGTGAALGLPFGPLGVVGGAIAGALLEPVALNLLRFLSADAQRRSGEALSAACEASGLSAEDTLSRMFSDEKFRLLAGTAMVAAAHTTLEDKVRTLGRSLASGLLASDDAAIDIEQMIMLALADLEAPQLALLDLLVAWRPPQTGDETSPIRLDIPEHSHSQPSGREWSVNQRKWYVHAIQTYRPRLTPVFSSLVGTLERHGLVTYESNVDDSSAIRDESYDPELQRPYVEPTELGEHVWLRFYRAGMNLPHVWVASPPSPKG
jgi:hypothetical protein